MQAPHPISEAARDKKRLRQQLLMKRQQIPHASMLIASEAIGRHFSDHPILAFASSFSGYIAMRGELDVLPVFTQMERLNKRTALPRMDEDSHSLYFHPWALGDPLVTSAMGVREPQLTRAAFNPEIILVPLVGFDADGFRLGYGGGWYDRTMQRMRSDKHPPLFIGVAYSSQEVDRLPIEAHDQPLDGILTELGVSMFRMI